jgi:hypothetical protein
MRSDKWRWCHSYQSPKVVYANVVDEWADEIEVVLREAASPIPVYWGIDWSGIDTSRLEMTHEAASPAAQPVTVDERRELHDLITSFVSMTDPDEYPDLHARAFEVTKDCEDRCVPHQVREAASPAPDAWQPVLQEAIDMASVLREAASSAALDPREERLITLQDALRVWDLWRHELPADAFTHSDGMKFVRALTSRSVMGRCPDCSFDPTNLNDYCPAHRPKETA